MNHIVFMGNVGCSEKTLTYLEYAEKVLRSLGYFATAVGAGAVIADFTSNTEDKVSGLTAHQRAARALHAALKALRKSGGCLKDLSGCTVPSGWQQRLLTSVRIAAFFHGRKVDARNLP